jgi:hypothetical protein
MHASWTHIPNEEAADIENPALTLPELRKFVHKAIILTKKLVHAAEIFPAETMVTTAQEKLKELEDLIKWFHGGKGE